MTNKEAFAWVQEFPGAVTVCDRDGIILAMNDKSARTFEKDGGGDRVIGVRTDDKGVDKQNQQKSNFEPGYDVKAKVVVLAEGSRGSLTKQLIQKFDLMKERNPQTYGVGVKELWEVPSGRIQAGEVIYTMGYPLTTREYGGAWIYGSKDNTVSLGFVTGLDYRDPRLDPQHVLQAFKQHPFIARLLAGGKMIRYGAKSLPYGGWWSLPPLGGDGWMIVGDSAGFLNSQRLKGVHLAMKSGMLAAETAFEALVSGDSSARHLGTLKQKVDAFERAEIREVQHQRFRGQAELPPHGFARASRNLRRVKIVNDVDRPVDRQQTIGLVAEPLGDGRDRV